MIAGSDQFLNAGAEKTAFLGVVAGFVVLLLVFFLYLNKKWCFGAAANAFNCCDETQLSTQQLQQQSSSTSQQSLHHHQQSTSNNHHLYHQTSNGNNGYNNQSNKHHQYIFGNNKTAYSLDSPESSSDSELDVIRRLQQSASFVTSHQRGPSNGGGGFLGIIGSPTSGTQALITSSSHRPVLNSPPPLISNSSNNQIVKTPIQSPRSPNESHDLISLVEKGRVGVNNTSNVSSCCSSTNSSLGAGQNQIRPISETHIHHVQMATHRAIAQDIRETRIDNFGDPDKSIQNGGHKYKKLTTDSSVESQSTDINSNSNSNQDCIVVLGQESCYDTDGQSICTSIGGGMERDPNEITKDNGGGIQQDGAGNNTTTSSNDKEVISKCGHLEVALLYDAPMRKMTVHVLQARDIPSRDRGQPTHTQVRLLLLPSKKQKHKTKIRSGDNPQYMESFLLHRINPEDVNSMGLRLRVYGCERMRREQLIGECVVSFSSLDLELETTLWLALEPRATSSHHHHSGHSGSTSVHHHGPLSPGGNGGISGGGSNVIHGSSAIHGSISPTHHVDLRSLARSDSTGSAQSMQHGGVPELLLGLAYNATTGRLSVEIVKGSHFRNLAMNRAPDTYVKLCLVSSNGQEMARSKTSVRRGQPNPLFKETFVFQVALFQLADVTLMISVYNRKGMTKRKEMIGWFSLGLNSSGPEQLAHWLDMKDLHAQQLCRWHVLVDS